MNQFVEAFNKQSTHTNTLNGGLTYSTSDSKSVDLFFNIGAIRGQGYSKVVEIFEPAFKENPELALKIVLWARDAREGAGERLVFRHVLQYLIKEKVKWELIALMMDKIPELGRFDDFLSIWGIDETWDKIIVGVYSSHLTVGNSLAAKWAPRKGPIAKALTNTMKLTPKEYRKMIVGLTNVVETKMCAKDWKGINYSQVPSKAMTIYSKAFSIRDTERFTKFKDSVINQTVNEDTGKVEKINAGAIYPYEVAFMTKDEKTRVALWQSLPDFVPEGLSFLPMIDTSSSMNCSAGGSGGVKCLEVAASIGIYLAERNKSDFKNLYLNFDSEPKFKKLKGSNINDYIRNLDTNDWGGSTNLSLAFKSLLDMIVKNNIKQDDIPKYVVVLSDMEFNGAYGNVMVSDEIKQSYTDAGYKAPGVIWWNIHAKQVQNSPVKANDEGMALVSGYSPSVMTSMMSGKFTPFEIMLETINKERYEL